MSMSLFCGQMFEQLNQLTQQQFFKVCCFHIEWRFFLFLFSQKDLFVAFFRFHLAQVFKFSSFQVLIMVFLLRSVEARVCVFDYTPSAMGSNCPISLERDSSHVLDVEVLQTTAIPGHRLHSCVSDKGAAFD